MTISARVARVRGHDMEYLAPTAQGAPRWVASPAEAAAFESLREATRQALRLPAAYRAFAMPTAH